MTEEKLVDDRPVKDRVAVILNQTSTHLAALHKNVEADTILAVVMAVCISPRSEDEAHRLEWVYSSNLKTPEALVDLLAELAETISNPKEMETIEHRMI